MGVASRANTQIQFLHEDIQQEVKRAKLKHATPNQPQALNKVAPLLGEMRSEWLITYMQTTKKEHPLTSSSTGYAQPRKDDRGLRPLAVHKSCQVGTHPLTLPLSLLVPPHALKVKKVPAQVTRKRSATSKSKSSPTFLLDVLTCSLLQRASSNACAKASASPLHLLNLSCKRVHPRSKESLEQRSRLFLSLRNP